MNKEALINLMLAKINADDFDNIHEEVNLLDDRVFRDAFREPSVMTEFLRVALGDPELEVEEIHTEHELTNPGSRAAVLDAFCRLGDGRVINVETQHAKVDDAERRVRYYGSLLTARLTPTNSKFSEVPDVVVFFIMDYDDYHDGEVVHEIKRYEPKTGRFHDNGFREIYLTASVDDGTEISELLQTLKASKTFNPKFPAISEYKRNYNSRPTEKGKSKMLGPRLEKLIRVTNEEAVREARPGIIEKARPEIMAEGAEKNDAMIQELVRQLEASGRSAEIGRAILDLEFRRQVLTEFFPGREF